MKNADKPIHPCMMQKVGDNEYRASKLNDPKEFNVPMEGLTKREYFMAKILQGLLAAGMDVEYDHVVRIADNSLEALEESPN